MRALVLAMALCVSGCTGVDLALIGMAASAAGSTASVSSAVYKSGKINAAHMAEFDRVVVAAHQTVEDLGLHVVNQRQTKSYEYRLVAEDLRGARVTFTIRRHSQKLTRYRIDVSFFGSEAFARLVYLRMRTHLPVGEAEL